MDLEDGRNNRVLIVDDDEQAHQSLEKALKPFLPEASTDDLARAFGSAVAEPFFPELELIHATSGKEAYQIVKDSIEADKPIAVAYMDIRMPPGWDGVETTHKIREVDENIEIAQSYEAELALDTELGENGFALANPIREFTYLDLWVDDPEIHVLSGPPPEIGSEENIRGGGDTSGQPEPGSEEGIRGGGDVSGLVLPHFVVRIDSAISGEVILNLDTRSLFVPQTAAERRLFVERLARDVKLVQDDRIVGVGDPEATMFLNRRWPANFTGQHLCYNREGEIDCASEEAAGQDGRYVQDTEEMRPPFEPELDAEGAPVAGMLRDPLTRLTWQTGPTGCENACTFSEALAYCEQQDLRLPSASEMRTILHFGNEVGVWDGFETVHLERYWTTNPAPDYYDEPWGIVVRAGRNSVHTRDLNNPAHVRCVKGEPMEVVDELYKGSVEVIAGLEWFDTGLERDWEGAATLCEGIIQRDQDDWRVPNVAELALITMRPGTGLSHWSSTPFREKSTEAWSVSGISWGSHSKSNQSQVLCVRNIP